MLVEPPSESSPMASLISGSFPRVQSSGVATDEPYVTSAKRSSASRWLATFQRSECAIAAGIPPSPSP